MSCRCLGQCSNRAPQTQQDRTQLKGNTEGKTVEGEGKRKRRRGRLKENAATRTTRAQTRTEATGKGEDKSAGGRETETPPEEGEGTAGEVPGYKPTAEDLGLREIYGDWVHANPGTHLDGGVCNNSEWQAWWRDLAVMPSRRYDVPSGKVRRRFVRTLREELKGVRDRRWNSERFIIFQTVTLQQARHVTAFQAIRCRIEKRLDT